MSIDITTKKTIVDKIVVGTPIAKVVEVGFDSADVIGIVDSDYVQARQVDFYRDSAFVAAIVDSDYIQARETNNYPNISDLPTLPLP